MLTKKYISDFLNKRSMTHVYGVSGANIEDLFCELIQENRCQVILAKNEYNAAMMALGHYLAKQEVGVVLTTSGAGLMNTIPVLAEAYSSDLPLVVISGTIPVQLEGLGGFQDTSGLNHSFNVTDILKPVTGFVQKINQAQDLIYSLELAFSTAMSQKKPSVILIPKNIFNDVISDDIQSQLELQLQESFNRESSQVHRFDHLDNVADLNEALSKLNTNSVLILGEELLHLKDKILIDQFSKKINALVATVPIAKGLYNHFDPQFIGITGVMGHELVRKSLCESDDVILLGCKMDAISRTGILDVLEHKNIMTINELNHDLQKILPHARCFRIELSLFLKQFRNIEISLNTKPEKTQNSFDQELNFRNSLKEFNKIILEDDQIFADAGNTGAFVTHYLNTFGKSLFYISLGMGGMGNTIGASIGACLATRQKSYVFLGDGSFLMYGLEIHTALEHNLPIVFIVFNNNAHGMCSTREELFLGGSTGVNLFKKSFYAEGIQKMFPDVRSFEIHSLSELQNCLPIIQNLKMTCFVSINLTNDEIPPFNTFIKKVDHVASNP